MWFIEIYSKEHILINEWVIPYPYFNMDQAEIPVLFRKQKLKEKEKDN